MQLRAVPLPVPLCPAVTRASRSGGIGGVARPERGPGSALPNAAPTGSGSAARPELGAGRGSMSARARRVLRNESCAQTCGPGVQEQRRRLESFGF